MSADRRPRATVLPFRRKVPQADPSVLVQVTEDIEESLASFASWAGHAGAELMRAKHPQWLDDPDSGPDPGEADPAIAGLLGLARQALNVLKAVEEQASKSG